MLDFRTIYNPLRLDPDVQREFPNIGVVDLSLDHLNNVDASGASVGQVLAKTASGYRFDTYRHINDSVENFEFVPVTQNLSEFVPVGFNKGRTGIKWTSSGVVPGSPTGVTRFNIKSIASEGEAGVRDAVLWQSLYDLDTGKIYIRKTDEGAGTMLSIPTSGNFGNWELVYNPLDFVLTLAHFPDDLITEVKLNSAVRTKLNSVRGNVGLSNIPDDLITEVKLNSAVRAKLNSVVGNIGENNIPDGLIDFDKLSQDVQNRINSGGSNFEPGSNTPDAPAQDGDYLLNVDGDDVRWKEEVKDLPRSPHDDGQYALTVTSEASDVTLTSKDFTFNPVSWRGSDYAAKGYLQEQHDFTAPISQITNLNTVGDDQYTENGIWGSTHIVGVLFLRTNRTGLSTYTYYGVVVTDARHSSEVGDTPTGWTRNSFAGFGGRYHYSKEVTLSVYNTGDIGQLAEDFGVVGVAVESKSWGAIEVPDAPENIPDAPSVDGDYKLNVTSGALVPFTGEIPLTDFGTVIDPHSSSLQFKMKGYAIDSDTLGSPLVSYPYINYNDDLNLHVNNIKIVGLFFQQFNNQRRFYVLMDTNNSALLPNAPSGWSRYCGSGTYCYYRKNNISTTYDNFNQSTFNALINELSFNIQAPGSINRSWSPLVLPEPGSNTPNAPTDSGKYLLNVDGDTTSWTEKDLPDVPSALGEYNLSFSNGAAVIPLTDFGTVPSGSSTIKLKGYVTEEAQYYYNGLLNINYNNDLNIQLNGIKVLAAFFHEISNGNKYFFIYFNTSDSSSLPDAPYGWSKYSISRVGRPNIIVYREYASSSSSDLPSYDNFNQTEFNKLNNLAGLVGSSISWSDLEIPKVPNRPEDSGKYVLQVDDVNNIGLDIVSSSTQPINGYVLNSPYYHSNFRSYWNNGFSEDANITIGGVKVLAAYRRTTFRSAAIYFVVLDINNRSLAPSLPDQTDNRYNNWEFYINSSYGDRIVYRLRAKRSTSPILNIPQILSYFQTEKPFLWSPVENPLEQVYPEADLQREMKVPVLEDEGLLGGGISVAFSEIIPDSTDTTQNYLQSNLTFGVEADSLVYYPSNYTTSSLRRRARVYTGHGLGGRGFVASYDDTSVKWTLTKYSSSTDLITGLELAYYPDTSSDSQVAGRYTVGIPTTEASSNALTHLRIGKTEYPLTEYGTANNKTYYRTAVVSNKSDKPVLVLNTHFIVDVKRTTGGWIQPVNVGLDELITLRMDSREYDLEIVSINNVGITYQTVNTISNSASIRPNTTRDFIVDLERSQAGYHHPATDAHREVRALNRPKLKELVGTNEFKEAIRLLTNTVNLASHTLTEKQRFILRELEDYIDTSDNAVPVYPDSYQLRGLFYDFVDNDADSASNRGGNFINNLEKVRLLVSPSKLSSNLNNRGYENLRGPGIDGRFSLDLNNTFPFNDTAGNNTFAIAFQFSCRDAGVLDRRLLDMKNTQANWGAVLAGIASETSGVSAKGLVLASGHSSVASTRQLPSLTPLESPITTGPGNTGNRNSNLITQGHVYFRNSTHLTGNRDIRITARQTQSPHGGTAPTHFPTQGRALKTFNIPDFDVSTNVTRHYVGSYDVDCITTGGSHHTYTAKIYMNQSVIPASSGGGIKYTLWQEIVGFNHNRGEHIPVASGIDYYLEFHFFLASDFTDSYYKITGGKSLDDAYLPQRVYQCLLLFERKSPTNTKIKGAIRYVDSAGFPVVSGLVEVGLSSVITPGNATISIGDDNIGTQSLAVLRQQDEIENHVKAILETQPLHGGSNKNQFISVDNLRDLDLAKKKARDRVELRSDLTGSSTINLPANFRDYTLISANCLVRDGINGSTGFVNRNIVLDIDCIMAYVDQSLQFNHGFETTLQPSSKVTNNNTGIYKFQLSVRENTNTDTNTLEPWVMSLHSPDGRGDLKRLTHVYLIP